MKQSVLTRYRVMAYVTGVLLIALTLAFVGKIAFHISGAGTATTVIGFAHGWLYVVYLVVAFDMCSKAK
jgi:integral membrane protein